MFEAKPVKEEQDYALFIMQDKEFRMLPLTDEWFTFKPRVFGKLLDTDKAEKQVRNVVFSNFCKDAIKRRKYG